MLPWAGEPPQLPIPRLYLTPLWSPQLKHQFYFRQSSDQMGPPSTSTTRTSTSTVCPSCNLLALPKSLTSADQHRPSASATASKKRTICLHIQPRRICNPPQIPHLVSNPLASESTDWRLPHCQGRTFIRKTHKRKIQFQTFPPNRRRRTISRRTSRDESNCRPSAAIICRIVRSISSSHMGA